MSELTRRDFRAIMLYNFKRGLSADDCISELKFVFREKAPSRSSVYRWYKQFQRGDFNLSDDSRSGRPVETVTSENVAAVKELIELDRHVTYKQIEELLKISAPSVHTILHDHLQVRKICTLWVPHLLTATQMECRKKWCKKMLVMFDGGKSPNVNSIVTGDESWLYYYDVKSKSKNKIWIFEDEEQPTVVKQSRSVKKKMVVVFFGRRGIIKRICLDEQKTVTAKWYTEVCLPQLIESLKNLRPNSRLDTWRLHHDNAPAHRAQLTQDFLSRTGLIPLEHPAYSPDLAPCDFGLFPMIKDKLKGQRFANDNQLIQAWDLACEEVSEEVWKKIFDDWFRRMEKCIAADGNYFEKL